MLFAIKRRALPSLLLSILLAVVWLAAAGWLKIPWSLALPQQGPLLILAGVGVVGLSDAVVHGLLWFLGRDAYLVTYERLLRYFSGQNGTIILAGGLLAASEELFFRGILLTGMVHRLQWSATVAIVFSSVIFMLLHLIPQRRLALFSLWAFWESVLLGLVYVASGSLLVTLLVHALHDVAGFSLFAVQRRTAWLLTDGDASSAEDGGGP